MSSGFTRHRKSGAALATFTAYEADTLRSLAGQLIELLRNEEAVPGAIDPLEAMLDFSGPTRAPEDPVLHRLFPTAYTEDAEAAAEFRRFTEADLRNSKAAAAASVIDALEDAGLGDLPEDGTYIDVELDPATALSWMRCLTDMRLAIATRLGIEDEQDVVRFSELADDDPAAFMYAAYEWLAFLQETLVGTVA
ncbi:MAG: DUF2017 domain-containing protein [Marmoricola sp.]